MKIVLTFEEHNNIILPRMQLLHIHVHHKIIENIHDKILYIHHKITAYTSEDIEPTSQVY